MQRLNAALVAIAALAVAVPALVVTHPPAMPPRHNVGVALPNQRIVPQAELPPVEPVRFVDLSPEDARAYNAEVPFSTAPNPAARPFRFAGGSEDRARAIDCLAAGVIYEAGDDAVGERAVAQVVLNRLRHPAFPKTVCGVVFEGSERSTGCQFTFSCDGALDRWQPSADGWRRAREIATAALAGSVYRPVGYSTHYHTDWVVPYWQSSLDKVAAVHSHLFFRWTGWWGTPPAFNRQVELIEPVEPRLAALSDAHRGGAALLQGDAAAAEAALAAGGAPQPLASDPTSFLVLLDSHRPAESYRSLALSACGTRDRCSLMGWTSAMALPPSLPLGTKDVATMSFSYLRDRAGGVDKALWNCTEFKRPDRAQCMKQQVFMPATPMIAAPPKIATPPGTLRDPGEPDGVRRRAGPGVMPTPSPAVTPGLTRAPATSSTPG